jgi:hypothetical protein
MSTMISDTTVRMIFLRVSGVALAGCGKIWLPVRNW